MHYETTDTSLPAISNSPLSKHTRFSETSKELFEPSPFFLTENYSKLVNYKKFNAIIKPVKKVKALPLQDALNGIIDDYEKLFDLKKCHKSSTNKYKQSVSFSKDRQFLRKRTSIKENFLKKGTIDLKSKSYFSFPSMRNAVNEVKDTCLYVLLFN